MERPKGPGLFDSPYNDHGQITGTENPLGEVATQVYDSATGQLIAMVDPEGGRATFTYSANGKRNTTTDPAGNVSTLVYDELDRVTSAGVLGPPLLEKLIAVISQP